jgi:hypothetical protein
MEHQWRPVSVRVHSNDRQPKGGCDSSFYVLHRSSSSCLSQIDHAANASSATKQGTCCCSAPQMMAKRVAGT